jgi:predicted lipoprotein with Yx(FWY)xxD motif
MTRSFALLATLAILLAGCVLVACGDDDSNGSSAQANGSAEEREAADTAPAETEEAPTEAEKAPAARRRGPLVKLRDSQLGPVLFDGRDRALYLFTRDTKRSRCYGDCAVAWPPFYAKGQPRAAKGVKSNLLGTIRRRDGRRQVTYKGQPLYFYVSDPKGQVLCNDIAEFGGTWFALTSAGDPPPA